eukprot:17207-Pyramimonas_sp.AAC.1
MCIRDSTGATRTTQRIASRTTSSALDSGTHWHIPGAASRTASWPASGCTAAATPSTRTTRTTFPTR